MLMDMIAVAIGFSLIMLLLSLIVTSLTQATQAVLRLRGRNLRLGIATALSTTTAAVDKQSFIDASELMNQCDDAALRRQKDPTSLLSRLLGPWLSWIDEDTFQQAVRHRASTINAANGDVLSDEQLDNTVESVTERFGQLQKPMQNRFEMIMRGVSLVWALAVAAIFQISTPMLVQELSTDPALRAQLLAAAPATLESARTSIDATEHTLDQKDAAALQQRYDDALNAIKSSTEDLSLINIEPLQYGWGFYTDGVRAIANILGVILTAILLTLGAPFWYSALETAVRWRDLFAPKPTGGSDDPPNNGNNE